MSYPPPPPYGQPGYYPPPQPHPGYQPYPQYHPAPAVPQQQSSTNVVVVQQQQPQTTVVHTVADESPNHCLHCIITFFFFPWIFVWICLCCIYGCWSEGCTNDIMMPFWVLYNYIYNVTSTVVYLPNHITFLYILWLLLYNYIYNVTSTVVYLPLSLIHISEPTRPY